MYQNEHEAFSARYVSGRILPCSVGVREALSRNMHS